MAVFTDKVAPTLGCFVANGMFLSGLPAVLDARKQKSLGELNPIPFPMALGNALGWLIYAYVTKNPCVILSRRVFASNPARRNVARERAEWSMPALADTSSGPTPLACSSLST